ncbi:inosine/xanthosine triphosphatase [Candidatus Peregrinibacteria bacterium HGW-Peregrinibacteria-1]|jgi:inosine/xanthosine triphosphatase|nr:MAG: inosine/xanthosine triphosphatase [Candidatus Peregrinibacteria bacterium HGW-Peregrinibacteria-1]
MKIFVGSANKGKIEAVRRGIARYGDVFEGAVVEGVEVESGVGSQPMGLDEIVKGAINRAKLAYESGEGDLGFGLESGIFLVPYTKSDYMDTTACAIYDGANFHLGLSSCFEYPREMIKRVLKEGKEITDVALDMGFSESRDFRENSGMVGILTKGVVSRVTFSEQAVWMAMIHLVNGTLYSEEEL